MTPQQQQRSDLEANMLLHLCMCSHGHIRITKETSAPLKEPTSPSWTEQELMSKKCFKSWQLKLIPSWPPLTVPHLQATPIKKQNNSLQSALWDQKLSLGSLQSGDSGNWWRNDRVTNLLLLNNCTSAFQIHMGCSVYGCTHRPKPEKEKHGKNHFLLTSAVTWC